MENGMEYEADCKGDGGGGGGQLLLVALLHHRGKTNVTATLDACERVQRHGWSAERRGGRAQTG